MSNVGANNRFLQSNLTRTDLASETTLKKLESSLTGTLINSINDGRYNSSKLRVMYPKIIYRNVFDIDLRNELYTRTTTGIPPIESFVSGNKISRTTTAANTSGSLTIKSIERINCNNISTQVFISCVINSSSVGSDPFDRVTVGVFDVNDGFYFQLRGGGAMVWIVKSSGSETVTQGVFGWNIDRMDGTGISGYDADYTEMQTFVFDFNESRIRFGLLVNGEILYAHQEFANNKTDHLPTNLHLPISYIIEQNGSNPVWFTDIYGVKVLQENIEKPLGFPRSVNQTTLVSNPGAGASIGMIGVRYSSLIANSHNRPLDIMSIDYAPTASGAEWCIHLVLNPSIAGVTIWGPVPGGGTVLQYVIGVATNTSSGGIKLYTSTKLGSQEVSQQTNRPLFSLREGDEIWVVIQGHSAHDGRCTINWIEH